MNKFLLSLTLAIVATFTAVASAEAAGTVTCTPIYGGGQSCVQSGFIVINKEIQKPGANSYVDNLTVNDPKYAPGETFNFRITVTNTGGSQVGKVTIRDFLPQEVTFVAGPGVFKDGVFSADILNLAPNQSQALVLTVKANSLPNNESQRCEINNKAIAIVDGQIQDNARFCIQQGTATPSVTKGGLKVFPPARVKTTPPTGPEMFALAGLLPTGVLGYFLRKKAL